MRKEMHIHLRSEGLQYVTDKREKVIALFQDGATTIHTTLTEFCSTTVLGRGYIIILHFPDNTTTQLNFGKVKSTSLQIKAGMDLESLLLVGEFGNIA